MTAKNVTNNHTGPLQVGGVNIGSGATARIDNWQNVEGSKAVAAWIDAGILTIANAKDAPAAFPPAAAATGNDGGASNPPASAPAAFPPAKKGFGGKDLSTDPDGAAKDALIARLTELTGATKTRASSLDSLKKQVEEAEKQNKGK